jgi:chromate transporter
VSVSPRALTGVFARVGVLSFGGPAAQIALMHRVLVEEKRWIDEPRFLHALNFCMLLPGPEAMQLATYVGWAAGGLRGGLIAGGLFVLPGLAVMLALSAVYAASGGGALWTGLFFGLKAAALALVFEALFRLARKALTDVWSRAVAALAFVALFVFGAPFPLVILAAGLAGAMRARGAAGATRPVPRGAWRRASLTLAAGLALWAAPVALAAMTGPAILVALGLFFSKMAVVTFGGAYAALAYVAQQAVESFGWLKPGEMLDGLALAETTPGPLILTLVFVGFQAAFRAPATLPPLAAGTLGALLTAWVTFVPCFLWIFLAAPFVEGMRARPRLSQAMATISAAVVGVILNLAVWFALHGLFARVGEARLGPFALAAPDLRSFDVAAAALTALAYWLLHRRRAGVGVTLTLCAALGAAVGFARL